MAIVTTNDSQYLAETIGFALFDGISIVVESADYAKQAIDGYVSMNSPVTTSTEQRGLIQA